MKWRAVQVGDIFDVINGFAFSSKDLLSEPQGDCWEVLKMGHISPEGGLRIQPKREYAIKNKRNSQFVLYEGDVVMGMTDMKSNVRILGVPAMIDKSNHYALNQRVGCLRIKNRLLADNKYCYYQMGHSRFLNDLRKTANSGVQVNLTTGGIRSTQLYLPNLPIQKKIASILSAYDNLIENNNRRIRLLEQMAENLYKEWFVRFRFPGHEKAEFENGLPKGWKYENLFDVADVSYGYAFKSDMFCTDDSLNAVVRIRDIQDNHTDTYTSEECDAKYLIEENAILVGMDGLFHMCLWNGKKAYLNQRVVKINSKIDKMCNYLLFMEIRPQIKFWEQVIAGTTVAHLGDKHLKKVKVAIPNKELLDKANSLFQKIMVEKNQLFKQNMYLSRQRDLLLPRLMSGKLEVKV